jgi:hypothetical protein
MTGSSPAFEMWWSEYQRTASLGTVHLGVSREDLRALWGEPDAASSGFRHQPNMGIWRFGPAEFHFDASGHLFLIYTEDEDGKGRVIATSDTACS